MPTASLARINLQLRELAQLFNSMDPSPFRERDLDADAEEFIVSWARELHGGRELELVITLATEPDLARADDTGEAVRHYFLTRAEMKHHEFRRLMRLGRRSSLIGFAFLALCLLLSRIMSRLDDGTIIGVLQESLIIVGWVAMWRPLEIYLYDWWPVREEWRDYQRLARMSVRVVGPSGAR